MNQKKRIVIDARESGTSTGTYIDSLIKYLHQLRPPYQIIILTKRHRLDFFKQMAPNFEVRLSPFKEFTFAEQIGFLLQLQKLDADLVHFGMAQQPVLYRGKVITTMHDLTATRFKNPSKNQLIFALKQYIYKWVNRRVAKKSVAIITPTEFVKNDVARFARINSSKITVTYEAADKISDPPEAYKPLSNKDFIMFVGRPQPHKNLEKLVDAFVYLKKRHPKLLLVFVGKTDATYEQLANKTAKKTTGVLFTDWVSEGQKRWLYEHTKAYVFPSLSEGFGLPPLEAMQHGAPVVSSNATCLPEVNQDAALYFDPNNAKEMAEKIQQVLENTAVRERLVKKGHALVKTYSWQRMAEQTLGLYTDVLGVQIKRER